MYHSIEEKVKHPADFRVKYHFYDEKEGGRKSLPFQGYSSDFWYDFQNHVATAVFMIRPEFEDIEGRLIVEDDKPIASSGTARMWIIVPERRKYHRGKIKPGIKGYFMEGVRMVAECEVIELVGLDSNPIE